MFSPFTVWDYGPENKRRPYFKPKKVKVKCELVVIEKLISFKCNYNWSLNRNL